MITLTPAAADKLRAVLVKEGKPQGFLRVRVTSGGCSGLSIQLDIADAASPEDRTYESSGARVVVDPRSEPFVQGARVDYKWTLLKSGFVLENPNAASSCSCGTSFAVDESFTV